MNVKEQETKTYKELSNTIQKNGEKGIDVDSRLDGHILVEFSNSFGCYLCFV